MSLQLLQFWHSPKITWHSKDRNIKTEMILRFWTDKVGQTVQTEIKILLEGQSDLGLHCLLFHLCLLETIHGRYHKSSNKRVGVY